MIQIYNTLTRRKEAFHKPSGEKVTMYVCGPTVYKPSHIGHMVGPVIFDTVKRYLNYVGYPVSWVVNITDVDDKLIVRAREQNTTVKELAEKMTADYFECLKKLNVTGIDHFPKATEHIQGMIATITNLINKGYAYPANGDVYFNIAQDSDYGKLAGFDPEELDAGARLEANPIKKNPGDFALWKGAKPGEPSWESPWGAGRPGWHIECTCMAISILGETLDIHGGGLDLRFPHHENELAQSESSTDKPFARYWMHNGLLKLASFNTKTQEWQYGKMAGSVGNVINVEIALKHISGAALRFFFLNTHYRSPIDLGEWDPVNVPGSPSIPPNMSSTAKAYEGFLRLIELYERVSKEKWENLAVPDRQQHQRDFAWPVLKTIYDRFIELMDDDFNTGGACGVLFELVNHLNRLAAQEKLESPTPTETGLAQFREGVALLKELGNILGLFFEKTATLDSDDSLVSGLLGLIIELRNNLRAEAKKITTKDDPMKKALFGQTDLIRTRLGELKVTLEDRQGGTTWRIG